MSVEQDQSQELETRRIFIMLTHYYNQVSMHNYVTDIKSLNVWRRQ